MTIPVGASVPLSTQPPNKQAQYEVCPLHTNIAFRVGGFCESCYAEETQGRIRRIDEGFAQAADTAVQRLKDVLELGAAIPDGETSTEHLKAILGPVLRAIEILEKRFKRPERMEIAASVKTVSLVGSPIDFAAAAGNKQS